MEQKGIDNSKSSKWVLVQVELVGLALPVTPDFQQVPRSANSGPPGQEGGWNRDVDRAAQNKMEKITQYLPRIHSTTRARPRNKCRRIVRNAISRISC